MAQALSQSWSTYVVEEAKFWLRPMLLTGLIIALITFLVGAGLSVKERGVIGSRKAGKDPKEVQSKAQ